MLLALSLAGCPEAETGPVDTAESTVKTLLHACAHESAEAALPVLTPPERSRLVTAASVADGCERVLGLTIEGEVLAPEVFEETSVDNVTTDGGFGTATIRAPGGEASSLELESRGSRWFVSNPALP